MPQRLAAKAPSDDAVLALLLAVTFLLLFFYAWIFALAVQDRVIRLEMMLRLAQLLRAELRVRIGELTVEQLVALRFASDTESPRLAQRLLSEKIADRAAIKKMLREWKPDFLRA